MPDVVWSKERLDALVRDRVQESLTLEYKEARALDKADSKKRDEIAKDVSALANSAGGTLIYGVVEDADHCPCALTPVDARIHSQEWLENMINTITPRLTGVVITPVVLSAPHEVAYVVEIPQSFTAHQHPRDRKYYKRFNFSAEPMADFEIRDVMNRNAVPRLELDFELEVLTRLIQPHQRAVATALAAQSQVPTARRQVEATLSLWGRNTGGVFAQYVVVRVSVPAALEVVPTIPGMKAIAAGHETLVLRYNNTVDIRQGPDVVGARQEVLLPGLSVFLGARRLNTEALDTSASIPVSWVVHADHAPPQHGHVLLKDIPRADRNETVTERDSLYDPFPR